MKFIYCANCGQRQPLFRKALPAYGRIIDLIEPHECTEEAQEFDLEPLDVPVVVIGEDNKFVQKLNELPNDPRGVQLADRRPGREELKTSAPPSLQGLVDSQPVSEPEGNVDEEPENEQ